MSLCPDLLGAQGREPNRVKLSNGKIVEYDLCSAKRNAYSDWPNFKDFVYLGKGRRVCGNKGELEKGFIHCWGRYGGNKSTVGQKVYSILEVLSKHDLIATHEERNSMTVAQLKRKYTDDAYSEIAKLIDLDGPIKKVKNKKKK